VLGTCTAVLVVMVIYTTAPGPSIPVKHTRPIKSAKKKKIKPKMTKKVHKTR